MVADGADGLGGREPLRAVEVADLVAVFVQGKRAAVAQEEARQVPAVGNVDLDLFAGLFGGGQQRIEGFRVLVGDDGPIVIEEVAVVGGHGVAVKHPAHRRRVDRAYGVGGHDGVMVARDLIERVGVDQVDDLVVGVGEHVGRRRGVLQIAGLGVRLAHDAIGEFIGGFGMLRREGLAQLGQQLLVLLAAPYLQRDGFRKSRTRREAQHRQGKQ